MPTSPSPRVLVVDDNRTAAQAAAILLRREGMEVEVLHDGAAAVARLQGEGPPFELVLTDLRMEPVDGLEVVRAARATHPATDAIVMTGYGSVEAAVEAMRLGATDFLTKPVAADQLLARVRNHHSAPQSGLALVGESEAMVALRAQAARLAKVRSTVLLAGDTGTGRRHFAQWLHENGPDSHRPLRIVRPMEEVAPEQLEAAGTLLLPNVDDWGPEAQALIQRQLYALDPGQPPRVVATASPAVGQRAAAGELATELYFHLAVIVLHLVPLRERPEDISPLLRHFTTHHSRLLGKPLVRPSPDQLETLLHHGWPGNVRELTNLCERAVVMGPSTWDLSPQEAPTSSALPDLGDGFDLAAHLEWTERTLLTRAREQANGDMREMVRLTGLERNRLRYKLNKYSLLDRNR